MRGNRLDARKVAFGMHQQAVVDVEHFFAEDRGRAAKREVVERGRHRTFEGVFHGYDAVGAAAAIHAVEHLAERRAFHQVRLVDSQARGKGPRGLVAVRSGGSQVGERSFCQRHIESF